MATTTTTPTTTAPTTLTTYYIVTSRREGIEGVFLVEADAWAYLQQLQALAVGGLHIHPQTISEVVH